MRKRNNEGRNKKFTISEDFMLTLKKKIGFKHKVNIYFGSKVMVRDLVCIYYWPLFEEKFYFVFHCWQEKKI